MPGPLLLSAQVIAEERVHFVANRFRLFCLCYDAMKANTGRIETDRSTCVAGEDELTVRTIQSKERERNQGSGRCRIGLDGSIAHVVPSVKERRLSVQDHHAETCAVETDVVGPASVLSGSLPFRHRSSVDVAEGDRISIPR